MRFFQRFLALAIILVLAACGGGGSVNISTGPFVAQTSFASGPSDAVAASLAD